MMNYLRDLFSRTGKREDAQDLPDVAKFITEVRESRDRADCEREASLAAIKKIRESPPFEPDMFPPVRTRLWGEKS